MAVRLPDTAEPMGNFAGMMAEHIEFKDGEKLQEKYNNGQLGGGGAGYTEKSQAQYDALSDDEKLSGKEYRTYDTGHIYKLGVEYGKDAYFTSLSQLGLTADATLDDVVATMPKGSSAILAVTEFTNAKTMFPYEEGNDYTFGRVYIVKGNDIGRTYAKWFRKDGAKEYIAKMDISTNAMVGWKPIFTNYYTSLAELGLTAPTTVGEVFVAMPNKSMLMLNVEAIVDDGNVQTVTDVPKDYGVLTIEKHTSGRHRIEYSSSLGGSSSDVRKWIGSIKGNDGTGLRWIELTGSAKIYTTMAQLGLDGATATVQDVMDAISVGEIAMLRSDAFNNNNWQTQCNGIQWGYLKIEKTMNNLSNIELQEVVAPNRRYFGTQSSGKFVGWVQMNTEEILHTSLSGNLAGITTVLDLVNALLTEYRALSSKKPVRFISGEITKTTLTDFPVTYGVLQITVAGWDVVEVRLAHSANGFKSMYYGFLTRISGQELISSITWEKVATTTITELSQLGLTSSATLDDVVAKLGVGQSAILTTTDFTNYKTIFPYSEEQDSYATVRVEKGYDINGSRTIVEWVRKDASKVAYGGLGANNKVSWWNEYALKEKFNGKEIKSITIDLSANDLQYSSSSGFIDVSLANYVANNTKIIRVEGCYIPPSDNTVFGTYVPVFSGNKSSGIGVGKIYHNGESWRITVAASLGQKGSGFMKLYYID